MVTLHSIHSAALVLSVRKQQEAVSNESRYNVHGDTQHPVFRPRLPKATEATLYSYKGEFLIEGY